MAASYLRTYEDIYSAVMEECKIQSSSTTDLARIKRDINIVYLNEVVARHPWVWMRRRYDLVYNAYISTGTVSVTEGSRSITFSSAPTISVKGYLFFVIGFDEVYKIASHTANSTSATLQVAYQGATNSTAAYKLRQNGLVLPTDCVETYRVWHDHNRYSLDPLADKQYLEIELNSPRFEGYPSYFRVTEEQDPQEYATISGLPASSTRASSGLIKTLVFASSVASYLEVGDRIEVSSASSSSYNGEFIIDNVSTTTISYVGVTEASESATADTGIVIKLLSSRSANESYRKLELYPSLNTKNCTIHVEGIRIAPPLENDDDEPLIPIHDRIILLYGTLQRVWSRLRNPEEAARNQLLFNEKIAKMAAKIQDSSDMPKLKINEIYLQSKKLRQRNRFWESF